MSASLMMKQVLSSQSGPFALLHRPDSTGIDQLDILFGEISVVAKLADIPLPDQIEHSGEVRHEALILIPHRQVTEQGFVAVDDGSPLIVMTVIEQAQLAMAEALTMLPNDPIAVVDGAFDIEDDAYASMVRSLLEDEIGAGEGSNFVIKRSFVANITEYSVRSMLSLFRRLLTREAGAYWTFLIHTGARTFIGATPERHISLKDGCAVMNPISGTYRYPSGKPVLSEVMNFLGDRKEVDELFMVLDEELKMMASICDGGGRVVGPFLREMSRLAHTEYYIEGRSNLDPRDILRETMFAPTVMGSPLENACRIIARYEPHGRGYYGGVVALISREPNGARNMDSAILIRTADIDNGGHIKIGVGATLVRHSDAATEIAETHAKAAGVLAALHGSEQAKTYGKTPISASLDAAENLMLQAELRRRNEIISKFWLSDTSSRQLPQPLLNNRRALIIDAEDSFTLMLAHQLRAIGLEVEVVRFDAAYCLDNHDIVVMGPGPGDPREVDHPKMMRLSLAIQYLLSRRIPFLAVCLSHQLLCRNFGLDLIRLEVPNQGTQRQIDLFSSSKRVGFYNSYVAHSIFDLFEKPSVGSIQISRDSGTGEVYALRGSHFCAVQFHIESVLTQDGLQILTELLNPLLMPKEVMTA